MPFDSLPDTPFARRLRLIAALRNLPPDFTWNFASLTGRYCAIGLAKKMGLAPRGALAGMIGKCLGLSGSRGRQIFAPIRGRHHYGADWPDVTPEMVADKLEREP